MWRGLAVIAIIICGIISTEADCTLDNIHFYREGAYWNPVQDTHQIGAGCVNCTCSNNTVKCSKVECPILNCEVPRYPVGACCPVCEVAPDDDGKAGDKDRNCEFEGRIYQHNQFFSNNHTNITPTKLNQCVNCICQSGQIYCFLKSCDVRKHCSKFYQSPDTCCPICVDNKTNDKIERRKPEDCTDGTGQERKNGTVWSPDVAGETNPCITCTCLNGGITCEREICPKLQCANSKSYPVAGKCCKTCDKPRKKGGVCKKDRKRRKKSRKNRRKNRRRNRKGRSKRKDGRRNKKKNRRRQRKKSKNCIRVQHNVTMADKQCPSIQPTDGALPCHYNNMCLPAKTEFIIYRFIIRGDKKADDTLIIAFDNVKTHLVEIWKYVISKDKIKQRQELNKCASSSFRRQVKSSKAILGAASVKSVKDFQRKLRRGLKGCEKKKKGCRLRTVRRQMVCFDLEDIDVVKCKN
ncbi:uncharacterized protein LOC130050367 isoform X2 [Ostrea edulis]|uniref:uncharacterized protein LOC130050367 isoform X2 n=1 Tax=Ostrea edulis TaxID=37623 RepID=UPI0024AF9A00|nr:uncharacterized protein LOC130050367 isoform X2 [Ostrea edulis]